MELHLPPRGSSSGAGGSAGQAFLLVAVDPLGYWEARRRKSTGRAVSGLGVLIICSQQDTSSTAGAR